MRRGASDSRQPATSPTAVRLRISHQLTAREQVVEGLRPLLDLPVEVVRATHGGPTDRTALERAL